MVPLVDAAVRRVESENPDADVRTRLPDRCPVSATRAISEAVEELVENAVVHAGTPPDPVEVRLERGESTAAIVVADHGPGIPEMERSVLTGEADVEPLYHGSGMGLWLVNLIVRQSGGVLTFDENDPQGTVVTVRLPTA